VGSRNGSRREFLRTVVSAGAGLGVAGAVAGGKAEAAQPGETAGSKAAAAGRAAGKSAQPAIPVPRKTLGSTGQTIPILLLGCGQRFDEKYDKLLHRAFKSGVDYLDTALSYADGWSHRTIAPFLKQIGDRRKVWVTSKAYLEEPSVEMYTQELDRCLLELETDYLDMYFMHAVDDPRHLDPEFIRMGEALRASGKTRFFGSSCHGDRMVELLDKAAQTGGIDVIMFRYSFARYGDLKLNQAIDRCKKAGIGLIAMKTQDSVPKEQPEVVTFKSKDFSLEQAKLKAVWADERIDAAVSHMDNTRKLKENVAAAVSPVQLSMSDFQQLRRIASATAPLSCQGCSHICEPRVAAGVRIAAPLRYLMYHESYGDPQRARALYARLKPEARRFEGVSFDEAEAACPQGIRIAERLRQAQRVLSVEV